MGGGINKAKLRRAYRMLKCPLEGNRRLVLDKITGHGELNGTEIVNMMNDDVMMPQTCVSMALSSLIEYGYVNARNEGRYRYFSVNEEHIIKVNRISAQLITHPSKIMEDI